MLGPGEYACSLCSVGRTREPQSVTALEYGALTFDLVVRGGLVVTSEQAALADVALAGEAVIDYALHLNLRDPDPARIAEIPAVFERGVPSFKLYTAYAGYRLPDVAIFRAMKAIVAHGGLAVVHAENDDVIAELTARLAADGKTGPRWRADACP